VLSTKKENQVVGPMSAKAYFWAREIGLSMKLKSSMRFILRELSDCHNQDTHQCNPSIAYIARYTGLNRKTVMSSLEKLEVLGVICASKRMGTSTNYELNFDVMDELTSTKIGTRSDTKNGTSTKTGTSTKNGTQPVPKTDFNQYQKRDSNLKENLKRTIKDKYKGLDVSVFNEKFSLEAIKEYINHRANLKKPLTQESLGRILDEALKVENFPELQTTPVQVLQTAIDNGWQGLKITWFTKSLGGRHANNESSAHPSNESNSQSFVTQDTLDEIARHQQSENHTERVDH